MVHLAYRTDDPDKQTLQCDRQEIVEVIHPPAPRDVFQQRRPVDRYIPVNQDDAVAIDAARKGDLIQRHLDRFQLTGQLQDQQEGLPAEGMRSARAAAAVEEKVKEQVTVGSTR